MDCPRCGLADVATAECPRCGVVVAKARARPAHHPTTTRAASEAVRTRPGGPRPSLVAAGLVVAVSVGVAAWLFTHRPGAPRSGPTVAGGAADDPSVVSPDDASIGPPPGLDAGLAPTPPPVDDFVTAVPGDPAAAEAAARDRATADRLAARIAAGQPLGSEDLGLAEDLFARYPEQARGLLEAALGARAMQERTAKRHPEALALLARAAAIAPQSVNVRRGLLAVRVDAGDWPGVESAARDLLGLVPGDGPATRWLAYSLVRQDRTREAIDVLASYLDGRSDPEAAAVLGRLRRERAAETGFEEQRLAHFHVRYDGEAHEDVGREILRVLDRHYAALRAAFGHEPTAPIPVILFSTRSYYDATGAPAWSGGEFDHYDGRIRVPIGGLTASLTPDLESTLLHEVAHAFITDVSGGHAPSAIQEGLAQWTEGKRSTDVLGDRGLSALADGRIRGVTGFYLASLVLVEDLIAQRGRSGINDLLAAMARTGDVDAAFREVYGRPFSAVQADTATRLRQRHGS